MIDNNTTRMRANRVRDYRHLIGGIRVDGPDKRHGTVFNPTTGETWGSVPFATAETVDQAVDNAAQTFPAWAATSPMTRARVMFRFKALVEAHLDELATLVSSEHGKLLPDARGSLQRGLEVIEFACGIPHLLKGEFSDNVSSGMDVYSMRQPLGVCAGITPFNFPAMVPLWMFPIALACGNTFVLKPSEKDPSCALRLAEFMLEAGAPPGALNVINGDRDTVDVLLADRRIRAVSFVGSTAVARQVFTMASLNGKRVQAMGGAKNHMVILPDADIDVAADALMGAAFGSAGERCMAISVAVPVGERTADQLAEALSPRVRALKIGAPDDPAAEMGPLITAEHRDKVGHYVDAGVAEGAQLLVDGRNFTLPDFPNGNFFGGTLFDRVQPNMRIYREEIFGPVLSVVRASGPGEALALASSHEYGNGVAVFTRDGSAARNFAHSVNCGMVGINVPIPVPLSFYSFGGWKNSMFGDTNQHGPEGIRFYTAQKTVTSRWDAQGEATSFTMPLLK